MNNTTKRIVLTQKDIAALEKDTYNSAIEEAAKVAEEWEPVKLLLPLCNEEQNKAAYVGQYEAGERIAAAIRALTAPKDKGGQP